MCIGGWGGFYRTMGKKDEAKAEFDKAGSITRAADDALINKMSPHSAQAPPTVPEVK
jgi:hypothetical protein